MYISISLLARSLGMIPVAPAFAGIAPRRIAELHPGAPHARLPTWGHFDEKYSGSRDYGNSTVCSRLRECCRQSRQE